MGSGIPTFSTFSLFQAGLMPPVVRSHALSSLTGARSRVTHASRSESRPRSSPSLGPDPRPRRAQQHLTRDRRLRPVGRPAPAREGKYNTSSRARALENDRHDEEDRQRSRDLDGIESACAQLHHLAALEDLELSKEAEDGGAALAPPFGHVLSTCGCRYARLPPSARARRFVCHLLTARRLSPLLTARRVVKSALLPQGV